MNPEMQNTSSGARKSSQTSLVAYTVVALGCALFIRFFIAAPYIVQGDSMLPTFTNLNYLIVDRVTYRFEEPQRGDVIVFDLPQNTSRALIKRIIGLPGESVTIEGNAVSIASGARTEEFMLPETYLDPENYGGISSLRVTLGKDQYFVLGDNRKVSADSRVWGVLPREDITGRVLVRLFPFSKIGLFPGEERYEK
jgi:signal peptidase I